MKSYLISAAVLATASLSVVNAQGPVIYSYQAVENVVEHTEIDLDVEAMGESIAAGNWTNATLIYEEGAYSSKTPPTMRTLQGFSKSDTGGIKAKYDALQVGYEDQNFLAEFKLFSDYYGSDTYADDFVSAALDGTMFNGNANDRVRKQFAIKGVQYQNVFMYTLYELYSAINKCKKGTSPFKAWDEGVAFYTGSLINPDGTGSGQLHYTLAQKRCGAFGQCDAVVADVNIKIFQYFQQGLERLQADDCVGAYQSLLFVRKHMQIPLIQGMLQYTLKGDPTIDTVNYNSGEIDKSQAEAWAFSRGVIPFMHEKDPAKAAYIKAQLEITEANAATLNYMPDRAVDVFEAIYDVMPKLCISCEEIGAAAIETWADGTYPLTKPNLPTCSISQDDYDEGCGALAPPEEEGISTGIIIGLILGGVAIMAAMGLFLYKLTKDKDQAQSQQLV